MLAKESEIVNELSSDSLLNEEIFSCDMYTCISFDSFQENSHISRNSNRRNEFNVYLWLDTSKW